jgi:hypothetical protein
MEPETGGSGKNGRFLECGAFSAPTAAFGGGKGWFQSFSSPGEKYPAAKGMKNTKAAYL